MCKKEDEIPLKTVCFDDLVGVPWGDGEAASQQETYAAFLEGYILATPHRVSKRP